MIIVIYSVNAIKNNVMHSIITETPFVLHVVNPLSISVNRGRGSLILDLIME